METTVDINENTLALIRDVLKKDLDVVINEALNIWTSQRVPKCPIDEEHCTRNEPCNNCVKLIEQKL